MKIIQKIPLPISGVALAIASLGNLLLPHGQAIHVFCGVFAAFILGLFLIRVICDTKNVIEDLKSPVMLGALPTSTMAAMLLLGYIQPQVGMIAVVLWYFALACHFTIMAVFIKRFILKPKLENVFPTWFVACVGMIVASVTSPIMGAITLGQIIFYVGFAAYIIMLILITYRMVKLPNIPEPARPTIAIYTAPLNLSIVGYFAAFEQPIVPLVYAMLAVSVVIYIGVTIKIIPLLKTKFFPSFAALTFPYVISATAFGLVNDMLISNGHTFFSFAPIISKWIAIAVVIYVVVRYTIYFATLKFDSK